MKRKEGGKIKKEERRDVKRQGIRSKKTKSLSYLKNHTYDYTDGCNTLKLSARELLKTQYYSHLSIPIKYSLYSKKDLEQTCIQPKIIFLSLLREIYQFPLNCYTTFKKLKYYQQLYSNCINTTINTDYHAEV